LKPTYHAMVVSFDLLSLWNMVPYRQPPPGHLGQLRLRLVPMGSAQKG
jgi:hypothetical protein